MIKLDKRFSGDPWSGSDKSLASGNKVITNLNNRMICEILPVSFIDSNSPKELGELLIQEEAANEQLIRMSPNLFNELESILEELTSLQAGKLTVMSWDINERIRKISNLLQRTVDIGV